MSRFPSQHILRVCRRSNHPTIAFAVDECIRYLRQITQCTVVRVHTDPLISSEDTINIGTFDDFSGEEFLEVVNTRLDDAIAIRMRKGAGLIAGANPRAVLLAVYQYVTALGCRFVHPGPSGEFLPTKINISKTDVHIDHIPSFRHRGLCSEGACSHEHVLSMVDWLPKVGMNSYFIEYLNGYLYYNNWYSQKHTQKKSDAVFSREHANEFLKELLEELKKRSMWFHNVGHGWTSIPFGIPEELWDDSIDWDFGDRTSFLRMANGERKMFHNIPRRTNLCYSKPQVRSMVANAVVEHCAANAHIDFLHFWLADGSRHFCECEFCRDTRPSDFYVMMLNEIDAKLTKRALDTRVVFIVYMDLLWPPVNQKIQNQDRFVMMFAPIHRSYLDVLQPHKIDEPMPKFSLNQLHFRPYDQNLNALAAWKNIYQGDVIIFDYRFMWDQYNDVGFMTLAEKTSQDLRVMHQIGINGFIGDQTQRAFFPTALPMLVNMRMLWDHRLCYEDITHDYFETVFGSYGCDCRQYLERLSDGFDPNWFGLWMADPKTVEPPTQKDTETLDITKKMINDFIPLIDRQREKEPDVCRKKAWHSLRYHADICLLLADLFIAKSHSDKAALYDVFTNLRKYLIELESEIHETFDVFLFLKHVVRKFEIDRLDRFGVG